MSQPRTTRGEAYQQHIIKLRQVREVWLRLLQESDALGMAGDLEGSWRKAKAAGIAEDEFKRLNLKTKKLWKLLRKARPP